MSALRFDDRVAVVTGAGTGIGAAHARLLAERGCAVVVNDIDADAARVTVDELVAAGGRAAASHDDISTPDGAAGLVATATDRFGGLDTVVNNAGVLRSVPFGEMDVETWDLVLSVNLRGTFLVTRAAWPHLIERGSGRIVSTSSNSGLLGIPGSSAYASSKAAIWGLTRVLALEGAEFGIQANAIAPMAFTAMSAASKAAPESWRSGEGDAWSRRLDVGHVAATVAWLAHPDCSLTGQVLSTAGGRVARFALRTTDGFVADDLTPEHIRDHEADLLLPDDIGAEYRAASEESRDLYRRLVPRKA